MKVLLIDPPYERLIGFKSEWFPLGLCSIASYIQGFGHEVCIYNAEHGEETQYKSIVNYSEHFHLYKESIQSDDHPVWFEAEQIVRSFKPDIVGISVLSPKVPSAKKMAKITRKIFPSIPIVCGGYHSTIEPEDLLNDDNVDYVVRGEGETTFAELLEHLQNKDIINDNISGLSYRSNGGFVHNPKPELIKELDKLPMPARESLYRLPTYTPVQLSMVMTSRGCPFDCAFCSSEAMWQRKVRFRSIGNVMDELRYLKREHSVQQITFMDDSFTINRERVKEFCRALIDHHLGITWSCLTRVDAVSDEIIRLMKKAGCTKVDIGVESGNQRILDLIDKRIDIERIKAAAHILKRNKMFWSGFFMFGFPTETKSEIFDTLSFIKQLKPNWANISIFTPYPGTKLYDLAKEKGIISDPIDYTLYSHQNPASRFTDTIPRDEFHYLASTVLQEVHEYNSTFRSLLKRAATRKYHRNPRMAVQDIKKAVSWLKK